MTADGVTAVSRHAAAEKHLARADPVLARLIAERGPCLLAPDPRRFGSLVGSIISQQISVKAAASILRRLEAMLPEKEASPESILALTEEQMRAAGLSAPKARSLRDLAGKVSAGVVDLFRIQEKPDEAVICELVQVRGIGRWTAEMFLIFSLGRPDVLPVDDLGFRTAVKHAYGLDALPDKETLRAIAAPWRPYASIATWHFWRSLDDVPRVRQRKGNR